jgi:hypothetical protein
VTAQEDKKVNGKCNENQNNEVGLRYSHNSFSGCNLDGTSPSSIR